MSERRLKHSGCCVYHLTSRVVQKRRLLLDVQREVWVRSLEKVAVFSGVEVITYCVLENHFHILVRINPGAQACDDAELVRRYRALYGNERAAWSGLDADELAHALAQGPADVAASIRERLRRRMGDVSEFMRTLRQRYVKWFNRTYDTVGTLWAERFGSVLVEDSPWVVALVAAYIDLNPVRAGLAKLPEEYRWTGYTRALSGHAELRRQYRRCFPSAENEGRALAQYRLLMLGKGTALKADGTGERVDREALKEAVSNGGELKAHELLQLRVRYFTHGWMLGSQAWIESGPCQQLLAELRRPRGAQPVEVLAGGGLACVQPRTAKPPVEVPPVTE